MSDSRHNMIGDEAGNSPAARLSRRKNTTKACEECRRRRAKCDGRKPSCSRCSDRVLQCRYTAEEDGRRPAPKSYVQLLRNRINVLERIVQLHSIDVDKSIAQLMMKDKSLSTPWLQPDDHESVISSLGGQPNSSSFEELCAAFEGTLSLDESLNFDQDGEVRYFGPTSGRLEFQSAKTNVDNTVNDSPHSSLEETPRLGAARENFNQLCQNIIDDADVSEDLQSHLIHLYFDREQPWYQVVNERLFRESQKSNGRYFSPLLFNCMLSLACRYSNRLDVRSDPNDPNTAGRLFLEKAEVLLHYDLKWPNITTIQSLSIMSTIYVAIGADAAGWLHQGMAIRLAIDMGLNLDSISLSGSDWMPVEEVELRRQIYWALYCHDKLFATYTGRVCTFLDSQGVVELPSASQLNQGGIDVTPLHKGLIDLSRNLEKILLALYAPKPLFQGLQKTSFLDSCVLELKNWFYDLPSELKIDRSNNSRNLPQVYTLHMIYRTSFILLMKPFLTKIQAKQKVSDQEGATDLVGQRASKMCYEAAQEICAIARQYRRAYGTFRQSPLSATHCILSAGLILLNAKNSNSGRAGATNDSNIELCLQVLEELSVAWNPARRLWQNLGKMYQKLGHPKPNSMDKEVVPNDSGGLPLIDPSTCDSDTAKAVDSLMSEFPSTFDFDAFSDPMNNEIQEMLDVAFFNGPALAFSQDSLPNDYNNFDTLDRWQFDDTW